DAYTKATKEVQGFVTEKATLTALVDRVKELKDGGSVADVEAAIAKLPIVKTDGTETETTLLAAQKEIKAAVALFDGLASSVQATVKNAEILA
ncbi:hypothetical protein RFZ44_25620, partial [Acinetobacter sp. 163]|nr:hypothetical protein [Acinetobacter sp. 163]